MRFASARFGWLGKHRVTGVRHARRADPAGRLAGVRGHRDRGRAHQLRPHPGGQGSWAPCSANATIWSAIGNTAAEVGWAWRSSSSRASRSGIILGRLTWLRQMADPVVSILNSVPYVLFLPLIIFWFGLGETARVLVVVWAGSCR